MEGMRFMIQIDYQDKRPIYEQVVEKIRNLIVLGLLPADEKLQSVRSLAIDLSINPNTIQKAYQELERQGFIYTVKGRGNFVAAQEMWKNDLSKEALEKLHEILIELKNLGVSVSHIMTEVSNVMGGVKEYD